MFILWQELEKEAKEICETATTGRFLNAREKPSTILIEMTRVGVVCRFCRISLVYVFVC